MIYNKTIDMILDEMIGANYILTQKQINAIRDRHNAESRISAGVLEVTARAAYEAGRKSDLAELERLVAGGRQNIVTVHYGKEISE